MKTYQTKINLGFSIMTSFIISFGLTFLLACGGSISTVGNPDFQLPSGSTAFYSPAQEITPAIAPTSSLPLPYGKFVTTDWSSGNPVYEIFNALQDYTYPDDEGVIDVSNIYKLLFEAGTNYDTALTEAVEMSTPATINSPFDFSNNPITYTHAADQSALFKDGDTTYALLTWIWDESPKMSYGVIEGSFNNTTGDLTLDMVYLVDYEGDSDYCLRTHISGNETTHQFTLKAAKFNTGSGAYAISILGTGVSQSDEADDYFLLKIIDNDNLTAYPTGRYYKFQASATEDDLMAHEINGYGAGEFEDPNNYTATIDALTFFALDGSDHATSVSDFADSTLTLDY